MMTMKVLMINYRYFISGGPEKYMFNLIAQLKERGHEVVSFSVHSNQNEPSEYEPYFVDPIGGMDQVYYEDYQKTPKTIRQLLTRSIYSPEVKRAVKRIIRDTNPDVVYVLHFVNKLSPSVLAGAKECGKRVVVRLSDYNILCPRFDFLHDNKVCEDCLSLGYRSCIRKRCVKDSFFASLVRVIAMKIHNLLRVYDNVDLFLCPSQFLREKMCEHGFSRDKVISLMTFTPDVAHRTDYVGQYGLYFGRMSVEKGLMTLMEAYCRLGPSYKLYMAGNPDNDEGRRLKRFVEEHGMTNVTFLGFQSGEALKELVRKARFVLMPALWYENIPNMVLEGFSAARPVISSRIGSLVELVDDGRNGLLFEPGDAEDLMRCIQTLDDDATALEMSRNARASFEAHYRAEYHFDRLIRILSGEHVI